MMATAPRLTRITWGCVVGVVAPAGTTTLEVTRLEGSAVNVTVTPPAGPGLIVSPGTAVSPRPTFSPGRNQNSSLDSHGLTVAVAFELGPLACITVEPKATPVTEAFELSQRQMSPLPVALPPQRYRN